MSHDIDNSTGKDAIAYVGETPWHGLGEALPENQPVEMWLKAARLEWELNRTPVQYIVNGRLRTMDNRSVLVRSDTGAALSIVSDDYNIVQPKEVIEFYRDLVDSYGYKLETAGALNGGRKVWGLAKTGRTATLGNSAKDELGAYLLLATSCDKSLATTAAFTSVRVVCQNTLSFAVEDIAKKKRLKVKVPHSRYFDAEQVKEDLGLLDGAWDTFTAKARKMTEFKMKEGDAERFIKKLVRRKEGEALSKKAQKDAGKMLSLWSTAPGQELDTAKETLWGTVNAVTYFVDHVRKGSTGERLDGAWFGTGDTLKNKAWEDACDLLV
jgi:phage/plasmid-like protein (TIGR03299 family)